MPTNTYTALATLTLTGTDTEVVFASIPATMRDLVLVIGNMTATAANTLYVRLNGDVNSNYSWVTAWGVGSGSGGSDALTNTGLIVGGYTGLSTSTGQTTLIQLMDYSATDKHKVALARHNNSAGEVSMSASRWANTAAVNQVAVRILPSGSFNSGSTFSLYGIAS